LNEESFEIVEIKEEANPEEMIQQEIQENEEVPLDKEEANDFIQ